MRTPTSWSRFVADKQNLWRIDGIARRYGQRPSTLLGLPPDAWAAWQVDQAAWEFGEWLDGMLAIRKRDGSPKHTLSELMMGTRQAPEQYAALGGPGVKKMAIPESGVW